MEIQDDTLKKGQISIYGWNKGNAWMDNFLVGETEADMASPVESMGKLSTIGGSIKRGAE